MENLQLSLFDTVETPFPYKVFDAFPDTESDEVEYKLAEGGFPDEFWKTYSAFANTKGGIIVLGVRQKKNDFIFEGLPENKLGTYKKAFWDAINNPNKVSVNLMTNEDVIDILFENRHFLAFKVPAASRVQRPVFITTNPNENTYKRNYEGDYKCSREEVRRMMADADKDFHADARILEGYTMDDFDPASIRQYRQLFASTRPEHPWLSYDDKTLLTHLGAYRIDRKTKTEGPTLAGMLMFGKTNSITDPECCPDFFPDYREILSSDPQIRWTDRVYPDGTWEANLFQFFRLVFPKLSSVLPKPFLLKNSVRQDETPAHTALREAFVNALIHTDYSAPGNIVIEQRNDVFKFTNPGTLLVSLNQYYQGGISECRNTSIQRMFLMIGSAEKAGSGVNKIMSGWGEAHWRTPFLTIETQPDRLNLELPMFSILPEQTLNELKNLFGDSIDKLSADELTILATCHIEGEITNTRLQYMINKHRTDITKILQDLCKSKFLLSENKSRWTTYHLNTNFLNDIQNENSSNLDTSTVIIDSSDTSTPKVDTLTPKVDTSTLKVDTSAPKVDTSTTKVDTSSPKVETSADIPKRLSNDELYALILKSCNDNYLSLDDIAQRVNRKTDYLKNKIFPKLISMGRLERLYPYKINHPNQKYKSMD